MVMIRTDFLEWSVKIQFISVVCVLNNSPAKA